MLSSNIDFSNVKEGDILMSGNYKLFIKRPLHHYRSKLIVPLFGGATEYIDSPFHKGMVKLSLRLAKEIIYAQIQLKGQGRNLTAKNCELEMASYIANNELNGIKAALDYSRHNKVVVDV